MLVEWDHRPADEAKTEGHHRRQHEEHAVGAGGNDGLLEQALDPVRHRLQQAEGAHDVGPLAELDRRPDLALEIGDEGERQQQRHHDREDVPDGQEQRV